MEGSLHRFVRLLRLHGVRIGVSEATDALQAAACPGVLADRELLRAALTATLVKDRRDVEVFERVFDAYFGLRRVVEQEQEHGHAHDDLSDEGELERFTLSEDTSDTPTDGHSHGKPEDIHRFFRPEDLAQQYNLHQEANRLDMASTTDEIVLSEQGAQTRADAARVQLSTHRMHNAGPPGTLARRAGLELDVELTVAEEMALLGWLEESDLSDLDDTAAPDERPDLAALRAALAPLLEGLPERIKARLEALLAGEELDVERRERAASTAEQLDEAERFEMEQSLRRLVRSLRGSPRARRRVASRGTVDGARTIRSNMRFDGVPFRPVTVSRAEDRPRLVVLCDASLSVRATARFTLHLVHDLQSLVSSVRTFVFVDTVREVTEVFADHRVDTALSMVMGGLPAGGLLDVDADSDYGRAFGEFVDEFGSALTRRTTLLVLGDGRGNGHDPGLPAFEEMARRCRSVVWLTPEPRYSWGLGRCDLPAYAEHCERVHVVRGPRSLEDLSTRMLEVAT